MKSRIYFALQLLQSFLNYNTLSNDLTDLLEKHSIKLKSLFIYYSVCYEWLMNCNVLIYFGDFEISVDE